jgi:hypothetical protein
MPNIDELLDGVRCRSGGKAGTGGGGKRDPMPGGRNIGRLAKNGFVPAIGKAWRNMPA